MAVTRFGIIGSGSWATALAKILTGNGHRISWWVRGAEARKSLAEQGRNPHYLGSVAFDPDTLAVSGDIAGVIASADCLVIAVPSAYLEETLADLPRGCFEGRKIVSAVKGILPGENILLNEYLAQSFGFPDSSYFTVMGPCHAEEVAAEKLSYLTFSGVFEADTQSVAAHFATPYLNTLVNDDIYGVQYAAVLKNIYAMAAGMAHGLDYGDNFLAVLIANCADEMAGFLLKAGIAHIEVGVHDAEAVARHRKNANYAASVYLGDLLVTCYSLYSRNRSFGSMIGKGYSVAAAQRELNMVAEGYTACRCLYRINERMRVDMPIAETVYRVCWENADAREAFRRIEGGLV